MNRFVAFVLLVVLSGASLGQEDHPENSTCPTWTVHNTSTNSCECGMDVHHIVDCEQLDGCPRKFDITVFPRCCMMLTKDQMKTVVGSCPFSMHHSWTRLRVPSRLSQLDAAVCGYTNRTGQLCGQCVNGTSPPVYSYYPQCVHCPAGTNNWAKYLAVSLLPTTLFFFGTAVVKFRATSPLMNGYIMFCQIIASPNILRQTQKYALKHSHQQKITWDLFFCWYLESGFFKNGLSSILSAPKCHNVAGTVSGLHHSSLPSGLDHPHLHTSYPPLPQLQTCGVALEALPQVLHSLSKAVGRSKLTSGCLCYLPPLVLCQVLKCFV